MLDRLMDSTFAKGILSMFGVSDASSLPADVRDTMNSMVARYRLPQYAIHQISAPYSRWANAHLATTQQVSGEAHMEFESPIFIVGFSAVVTPSTRGSANPPLIEELMVKLEVNQQVIRTQVSTGQKLGGTIDLRDDYIDLASFTQCNFNWFGRLWNFPIFDPRPDLRLFVQGKYQGQGTVSGFPDGVDVGFTCHFIPLVSAT